MMKIPEDNGQDNMMLTLYMLLLLKVGACSQLFVLIAMSTTHLFRLSFPFPIWYSYQTQIMVSSCLF